MKLQETNEPDETENLNLLPDILGAESDTTLKNPIYTQQRKQVGAQVAIDFLRSKMSSNPASHNIMNKAAIDSIGKYKGKLKDWDLRFGELYQLLLIYLNCSVSEIASLKPYIENELKLADEPAITSVKSNLIAGVSLSILSSLIIYLFKSFHNEIFEFIGSLIN